MTDRVETLEGNENVQEDINTNIAYEWSRSIKKNKRFPYEYIYIYIYIYIYVYKCLHIETHHRIILYISFPVPWAAKSSRTKECLNMLTLSAENIAHHGHHIADGVGGGADVN